MCSDSAARIEIGASAMRSPVVSKQHARLLTVEVWVRVPAGEPEMGRVVQW